MYTHSRGYDANLPSVLKQKKIVFIADPEVAERVVREVPKSSTYADSWAVIGRDSIISLLGHSNKSQ
jgi:hypothetical protein